MRFSVPNAFGTEGKLHCLERILRMAHIESTQSRRRSSRRTCVLVFLPELGFDKAQPPFRSLEADKSVGPQFRRRIDQSFRANAGCRSKKRVQSR